MNSPLICRTCMQVITDKFYQNVVGANREMLEVIVPEMHLDVSNEPKMCRACWEILQACIKFKTVCLKKSEENKQGIKGKMCYLCKEFLKEDIPLPANEILKTKLEKCIPDVHTVDTSNLFICKRCFKLADLHFAFIGICLETEQKIKNYAEIQGTEKQEKVDLYKIVQLSLKNNTQGSIKEETEEDGTESNDNAEPLENVKDGELAEEKITKSSKKRKKPPEAKMTAPAQCPECPFKTKYINNLNTHILTHKEVKMFQCDTCCYQTKRKDFLKRHLLTHKDKAELRLFRCSICPFETKYKSSLKEHEYNHTDPSLVEMNRCELCPYETKYKCYLNRHMLTHRDPSELNMFKCNVCSFETKRRRGLNDHMLTHKNPSEVTMYYCNTCSYETKRKGDYNRHMLKHKEPSEVKMYSCDLCSFKTKYRNHIARHKLLHGKV